ncbi:histone-like nucleoid-structuring protein Lsr2 [Lapillicoccus jejuensis]|uniref:Lsr2 protein n=1 Tax=Lapillicoccus jejuensis TaxID=402171 RepID=A0A542DXD3_9MICO|nr:Lsr2 family protein [Lapillicoccus jejuensis]TQJ07751.1 Lsr2 protein [Lapillicoccus jejuensis]
MAQRVQVVLEDDVDGGEASETVLFGLDGVNYEIDLNDDNAGKLRDALATWVGHARRSGGARKAAGGRKTSSAGSSPKRTDLSEVREWARSNGYEVSDRGRVSAQVQEAYDKAHG